MKIAQWFAQAFVRRIAYAIAALVLAYLGLSDAHAITFQQAYDNCVAARGPFGETCADRGKTHCFADQGGVLPPHLQNVCSTRPSDGATMGQYTYDQFPNCVAPEEYDTDTHTCVNRRAQCQARNDSLGDALVPRTWSSKCIAGCQLGFKPGYSTTNVAGVGTIYRGELEYSGDTCGTVVPPGPENDPDVDQDRQECVPVAGQSMCLKTNGDHCYSASTGRQICWTPGETGTKTDGPVIQDRGPGTNPPTPSPPPPGETLDPPKPPVTTTTTTPNVTITTTTVTTTTTNGTDGGPVDSGEPSDGSDDDDHGTGDCGVDQKLCDEANSLDTSEGDDVDGNSVWGSSQGSFTADESGFGFSRTCPLMPEMQSLNGQQLGNSDLCTLMTWIGFLILAAAHAHALYIMFGD